MHWRRAMFMMVSISVSTLFLMSCEKDLRTMTEEEIRHSARLGEFDTQNLIETLRDENETPEVRGKALRAIWRLPPECAPEVIELLGDNNVWSMKAAELMLSGRGTEPYLEEALRSDNPLIRSRAEEILDFKDEFLNEETEMGDLEKLLLGIREENSPGNESPE